ncbi:MAG: hypothetical protein KatS3mg039_0474 [Candidatus Kapaibacterium sp.]|nr:MAG: hypothetical protein KatS3mg039_0474 [Candidatus Kapabacteria bacterium]
MIRSRAFGLVLVGLLVPMVGLAQQGMMREEFYRKLESYFDRELIGDLNVAFPSPENVVFYSWDAGDFSGDGNYDLACVVRNRAEKGKRLWVYLFVDVDGFLTQIAAKEYRFIELPLEVGVVVRYGVCYITEKLEQFNWRITGFRFDGIALIKTSEFHTHRLGSFTQEQTINYVTLQRNERWTTTRSGNLELERKCGIVPLYPRGVTLSHGYQRRAHLTSVDYVVRGAYYWQGPEDCSLTIGGAYDSAFVYLSLVVRDDQVVTGYCDTCAADRIELWFDLYQGDSSVPSLAVRRTKRSYIIRQRPDAPLIGLGLHLGDFAGKPPTVKLLVSDSSMLTRLRLKSLADVAIYGELQSDGYAVRIRIPWLLLAAELAPPHSRPSVLGFLAQVTDIDNEFRPEEATVFANAMYQSGVVASEGEMIAMPPGEQFGTVEYVHADAIVGQLRRRGF